MKPALKKILLHLFSTALIVLLTLVAMIRSLVPVIASHEDQIASIISAWLKQPVTIQSVSLYWHGIDPAVKLNQVSLLSEDRSEILFKATQLQIGFNWLNSLWQRRMMLDDIVVSGVRLRLQQQADGKIILLGLPTEQTSAASRFGEMSDWLIGEKYLALKDAEIDYTDKNKQAWVLQSVNLRWRHWVADYYQLRGQALLQQKAPTLLNFTIDVSGDLAAPKQLKGHLNLVLQNFNLVQWAPYLKSNAIVIQQGLFNGVIQADWQDQAIKRIESKFVLKDFLGSYAEKPIIVNNAAADIHWRTNHVGQWQLEADFKNLAANFNGIFRKPLALNELFMQLSAQKTADHWAIQAPIISAKNTDVKARASGILNLPFDHTQSPFINLAANYYVMSTAVNHLDNYLPVIVLHPPLIQWLERSIKSCANAKGTFILRGALKDFPYVNPEQGEFKIDSELHDATLDFAPDWPEAEHIDAEMIFAGDTMQISAHSLQLAGVPITNVSASIPTLGKNPLLNISANIIGVSSQDGLAFIQHSPLKKTIGKRLSGVQLTGPMQLALQLVIPLSEESKTTTTVNGNIQLQNNTLALPAWKIAFNKLQGQLQFDQNGLTAKQLTALLFDQPVTLSIKTPDIQLQGQIIFKQLPLFIAEKLGPYLSGSANYQAILHLSPSDNVQDELVVTSDLKNTAVNLPLSLKKAVGDVVPTKITMLFGAGRFPHYKINYQNLFLELTNVNNKGWDVYITHPEIAGQFFWPVNPMAEGVSGHLRYVAMSGATGNQLKQDANPSKIPPLNIVIDRFSYGDKNFGAVQLDTTPLIHGLLIRKLVATLPDSTITITGNWLKTKTHVEGQIVTTDLAKTLAHWQLPAMIEATNGKMQFSLDWPGAPYEFSIAHTVGDIKINLNNGQILNLSDSSKAKMDIGRLFNILSFESIARRLRLNFSDLTQSGLNFDTLKGDFNIADGELWTNNVDLEGPIAQVTMNGSINLVIQTYNLRVSVTPTLTSSLPIIAAIAGGPIVGAVAWAANKVISPVVDRITVDTYTVTGPWAEPNIQRVE